MTEKLLTIIQWLLSTIAIYIVYQSTRSLIENDIMRAFCSMLFVAALNIAATIIYGGVIGHRKGHGDEHGPER